MGSERKLPGDVVGNAIGKVTQASVRHARLVVMLTLLATGALMVGIQNTQVDQELTDGLPESNPNKRAMDRVMDKLPGISTLEAVLLEIDPAKAGPLGINEVRHQDAIRAEEHVWQFIHERVPELTGGVGLHHVVKQVRVVVNNNDESFYAMPANDPAGRGEFDLLWGIANNTVKSNIELTIRNPDYQSTVLAIQYNVDDLDSDTTKEIGRKLTEATAAYREAVRAGEVPVQFDIWKEDYVVNLGPQSGLAKFEGHLLEELPVFVPAAFLLIFFLLWIGLRNPGSALIGIASLLIASAATVGLLGWLRIPFTSANIAMIPLIVGNGIDYAIHVLNEYTEERSQGKSLEATFRAVGGRAGVAMTLATVTSVSGILSMLLSTSIAMKHLAISSAFAILTVTILSLTFIPAATALFGDRMHVAFKPSTVMPKIYQFVNRRKALSLGLFLVLSGVFWVNTGNLQYFTDLTGSNFPEEDEFIQAYERLKVRQQGSADELVIIEGDLTDPDTLTYIRALEEDFMTRTEYVKSRAHVNSLTVLLGAYELLGNTPNAAQPLLESGLNQVLEDPTAPFADPGNPRPTAWVDDEDHVRNAAPTDRATIEADIEAMQANIAWQPLVDFLYSQDGTVTIIDVLVDDGGSRSLETLEGIQRMMEDVVANQEHLRPDDVTVHINGLSTGLYQYLDFGFKWLRVLFIVSAVVGTTMMFLFTRSWRATGAFLVPLLFTTTWFLGILPFFDILVGPGLILPIIFITSIGSDYAAHLSWNILKTGRPRETYRTTGKAIFFSAITDFCAFFIFSFSYLLGVRSQALATSLAILAIFVVTMLTVPLFFNMKRRDDGTLVANV
ncbi:MAG: efflux RND transporter permease subunit [Thermoplasmatota archaeon]